MMMAPHETLEPMRATRRPSAKVLGEPVMMTLMPCRMHRTRSPILAVCGPSVGVREQPVMTTPPWLI